jgi:hypothetical protein
MRCPFCTETIKDESVVCKNCSRDLRIVRPVVDEIEQIVLELDGLQRDLDRVNAHIDRIGSPVRYYAIQSIGYVLVPVLLLVAAHIVVTIVLNVTPLYLRLASVIIPLPFGFLIYPHRKVRLAGAVLMGFLTAALAVTCMLTVTGINDKVPIIPASWVEWREVMEYSASIALAYVTGNILGLLVFTVLPKTMARGGGKPHPIAYAAAGLLGRHVGEEHLRRRARTLQDLVTAALPMLGVAGTAAGSLYAGLKGVIGG